MLAPHTGATFFDGKVAAARTVVARLSVKNLLIEDAQGQVIETVPLESLYQVPNTGNTMRLGSGAMNPLARLDIVDVDFQRALRSTCPELDRMPRAAARQRWRVGAWAVGAVIGVLLVAVYGLPLLADRLTPLVPLSIEKQIGEAVEGQLKSFGLFGITDNPSCYVGRAETAAGQALDKLVQRLVSKASAMPFTPKVDVWRASQINAIALPGGKIIIFSPLLDFVDGPDQIAGIVAHELGHVRERHGLASVIHASGLGFIAGIIFGDVSGGIPAVVIEILLSSGYSRHHETDADSYAVALMREAGLNGTALARLFDKLIDMEAQIPHALQYALSHPLSKQRARAIRNQAGASAVTTPVLNDEEWQALKRICE